MNRPTLAPVRRRLAAVRLGGRRLVAGSVVLTLLAAGGAVGAVEATASSSHGSDPTHITAYFSRTVGVYVGNNIDVLGVKVGKIDSLTPEGSRVKVTMTLNGKTPIPANATAVVIPPSLVSDRYIQLQPAYSGGAMLADHAVLGMNRTAVPLEYDEIFRNLNQLTVALGPKGANKHGALSHLLAVSAANLQGNGGEINSALAEFSDAVATLSDNRGNLFGTVSKLQQFTTTLANDNGGVKALNSNLAKVGNQLADERADLGSALSNLSSALGQVTTFVADNRKNLTSDVHGLTTVSQVLVNEKTAIEQILDTAPEAVTNLSLAGDNKVTTQQSVLGTTIETLDTKADTTVPLTTSGAAGTLCQTLTAFGLSSLCSLLDTSTLTKLLDGLQNGGSLSGTLSGILGSLPSIPSLAKRSSGSSATPSPTTSSTSTPGLGSLLSGVG